MKKFSQTDAELKKSLAFKIKISSWPIIVLSTITISLREVFHAVEKLGQWTEAVAQRCPMKRVLLEISQNPQENTCARVSILIKMQAWGLQVRPATLLIKSFWRRWFPVNFAKFLRKPFFKEHLRWLLLSEESNDSIFDCCAAASNRINSI